MQNVESSLSSPGAVATHSFAAFPAQPVPDLDKSTKIGEQKKCRKYKNPNPIWDRKKKKKPKFYSENEVIPGAAGAVKVHVSASPHTPQLPPPPSPNPNLTPNSSLP